ncbi:hypothetical protein [Myxococcus stipitatus]|uniref:hypothetical protein n=1 Tax=Myxococcus stipitatus TaxID=83455 RepID=UPI0030CFE82F
MFSSVHLVLGAFLALVSLSASAQSGPPVAPPAGLSAGADADASRRLLGIWAAEPVFGPSVQGELTVFREGALWRASIGGFEVPGRLEKSTLTVTLPGGQGTFRGKVGADGKLVRGSLQFTRRESNQAVGLYARVPMPGPYVYRAPVAEPDGWTTASLKDVGMDPAPISALMQRLLDLDAEEGPTAKPLVQGVLVARRGKLVVEESFHGFDKERLHDLRSASKTLAPVLVGTAIEQGAKLTP